MVFFSFAKATLVTYIIMASKRRNRCGLEKIQKLSLKALWR